MKLSIIVAMSSNGVIGIDGDLPWYLPDDMTRFKAITVGKPVIMGRKTWESLGRPLPHRLNIVITNSLSQEEVPLGVRVAWSLNDAILIAIENSNDKEVMVIGGSKVYEDALKIADKIYLTIIHEHIEGDAYFPEITDDWKILGGVYRSKTQANPYNHSYLHLTR